MVNGALKEVEGPPINFCWLINKFWFDYYFYENLKIKIKLKANLNFTCHETSQLELGLATNR